MCCSSRKADFYHMQVWHAASVANPAVWQPSSLAVWYLKGYFTVVNSFVFSSTRLNLLLNISLFLHLLSELFILLFGRTSSWRRCWAAIRLSHRPEPSGRAVHEEVGGLDIGGQHVRRFVLVRHTHRPQRMPYPICTRRNGNVWHRCGGG